MESESHEEGFDNISMRLLMNKGVYKKYIQNNNHVEDNQRMEYIEKLKKYYDKIIGITFNKMDNPDMQITNDIDDIFEEYMKSCIRHFELKEIQNKNAYNELMFDLDHDLDDKNDNDDYNVWSKTSESFVHSDPLNKTYWGKSIHKIVKNDASNNVIELKKVRKGLSKHMVKN